MAWGKLGSFRSQNSFPKCWARNMLKMQQKKPQYLWTFMIIMMFALVQFCYACLTLFTPSRTSTTFITLFAPMYHCVRLVFLRGIFLWIHFLFVPRPSSVLWSVYHHRILSFRAVVCISIHSSISRSVGCSELSLTSKKGTYWIRTRWDKQCQYYD